MSPPRRAASPEAGYSLIELLIAVSVSLAVIGIVAQAVFRGQAVYRDRQLVAELEQTTRGVAALIADDIRRAGQNLPLLALADLGAPDEAATAILAGTGTGQLRLHVSGRDDQTVLTGPVAPGFQLGRTLRVTTRDASSARAGDHLFLWGETVGTRAWLRARVDARWSPRDFDITPLRLSFPGGPFNRLPVMASIDAVSWRHSGGSVLRGELSNPDPANPQFREMSAGEGFTALEFLFFDDDGVLLDPASLAARARIRRIGFLLEAETRRPLADGKRRRKAVALSVGLRNLNGY